ncbi:hypothetical protein C7U61_14500 [Rhizobium sp. JAB6]|uniref:hypothetical protein n=1 Tax=Rhizobium sp. JAB6 TaxID=2127050 RepID=UPI000D12C15E|nr:hypothetical protein [Rhizobium sp. JAB6]PST19702.1 hypothetical protein C7U61_14500 [Rhizobium sp. JAB6]
MTKAAFRQVDIERIIRAAKATGAVVQIDLRTLVVTIHPSPEKEKIDPFTGFAPDGKENWEDYGTARNGAPYGRENWED